MAGHQMQFHLTLEDAMLYLHMVQYEFKNQPQVYRDFVNIVKDYKFQRINISDVLQRVSNLFRGHPLLLSGFNSFLPPGIKVETHPRQQVHHRRRLGRSCKERNSNL